MPKRTLLRSREGSALIEFAMLAPVFFMMVMGLVEFVLYQYKSYALNHVTYEAARHLQTGEALTEAAFKAEACAQGGPMIDCTAISFDVRAYNTISEVTFPAVTYSNGQPSGWGFAAAGPSRFQVVRASVPHVFVTPFMGQFFGVTETSPAILSSSAIVQNEPW